MLAEPLLLLHTPTHAAAHNTTQHAGCCGQQPTLAYTPCHVRQENYANLVTALPPQNSPAAAHAEVRLHRICGDPDDDELELAGTENVESEGGRRLAPPPPFSELSSLFGPLEKYTESCGISGAAYHLRKAKMDFIHARSSKPAVQADIRAMFSDS